MTAPVVPRAWPPSIKFQNGIWGVSHRHRPLRPAGDEGRHAGSSCPTGGCGEPPQLPWVAAHSGASAARMGGMGGDRSRDHPKGTINAGQSLSQPVADSSCCGTQNSLLAYAHRILTAATPFCSLLPPLAALANVPLCTREPLGDGPWAAAARKTRGRHAGSAGLMGGFAGKIRLGGNFGGFFLLWGAKYPGKALQSQKKYDILAL